MLFQVEKFVPVFVDIWCSSDDSDDLWNGENVGGNVVSCRRRQCDYFCHGDGDNDRRVE